MDLHYEFRTRPSLTNWLIKRGCRLVLVAFVIAFCSHGICSDNKGALRYILNHDDLENGTPLICAPSKAVEPREEQKRKDEEWMAHYYPQTKSSSKLPKPLTSQQEMGQELYNLHEYFRKVYYGQRKYPLVWYYAHRMAEFLQSLRSVEELLLGGNPLLKEVESTTSTSQDLDDGEALAMDFKEELEKLDEVGALLLQTRSLFSSNIDNTLIIQRAEKQHKDLSLFLKNKECYLQRAFINPVKAPHKRLFKKRDTSSRKRPRTGDA